MVWRTISSQSPLRAHKSRPDSFESKYLMLPGTAPFEAADYLQQRLFSTLCMLFVLWFLAPTLFSPSTPLEQVPFSPLYHYKALLHIL